MAVTSATSIQTADASVTAAASKVQWILAAAGATGGAWQLNDSTDDSGTDVISGVAQANSEDFMPFPAELQFSLGIRVDIQGSNVTLTIGYSS